MTITLNLEKKVKYTEEIGARMSLTSFIRTCEAGGFINDDGYAREILLDGYIVYDDVISPSVALEQKNVLFGLESEHEGLEIVWYNA